MRATGRGGGYLPHSRIRVLTASGSSSSLRLSATSQLLICKSKFPSAASSPISTPVHLEQFSLPHLSHSNRLVKLDRFEQLDLLYTEHCCSIQEVSQHESKLGGKDGPCKA